jgi:hypothetical protein
MRSIAVAFLVGAVVAPTLASAVEPRIFVVGVWPNRIRFFDEQTESFTDEIQLRRGAVTSVFGADTTPDHRRFFFITDRMETVEVVDIPGRAVVDEIKLSSAERRVRILGVAPDAAGKRIYLTVRVVSLQADRFVPEDTEVILYDLESHQVRESFRLPTEVHPGDWFPMLRLSADGKHLFAFGADVFVLDVESRDIVDRLTLSRPTRAGYGPLRNMGFSLRETEPGVFYGIYRSTEPFLKKTMLGIARIDLLGMAVERFEVSPDLNVEWFALSPDGKRGYAGMGDLVAVDMESRQVIQRKEGVERGRQNTTMVVSADGSKLYVSGVGNTINVYRTATLEPLRQIFAGGDIMNPLQPVPRKLLTN